MTGDPLRLLHDPATAAVLRRDLGAASNSGGVGYDVDAGLARLQSSLATDLASGTGGGVGLSGGLTLGALVLASGLAALLGWQIAGPDPTPQTLVVARGEGVARISAPTPTIVSAHAPDLPTPASDVADDVAVVEEAPVLPASMKYPRVRRLQGARNEASALPTDVATGDALREARALNVARGQLGVDAAKALALAEAGASEYRTGTFAPEWEGVAVLALFELGRDDAARARADAYLERHPSGTYAPRIRKAIEAGR